ncbi:MAG: tautomerase family protein [Chloroflexota bacterium]
MPLVEVKVFENELSPEQTEDVIQQLTDVMVSFAGESLRDATWVIVEEVKSGSWGVGGNALGLEDIRAMQAGQSDD